MEVEAETGLFASTENLTETSRLKEKEVGLAGIFERSSSLDNIFNEDNNLFFNMFKKTPKPADEESNKKSADKKLFSSSEDLSEPNTTKEKTGGLKRIFKKSPKPAPRVAVSQDPLSDWSQLSASWDSLTEIKKENTVVVQPVEMAAYPPEERSPEAHQDHDELMEWWNSVKGWTEWNESSNFQEEEEEMAMEQAADRVYMAARVFLLLFNQRGASLQHRILELVALADAADEFHKKTVSAAVGGGVANVAGSITTITGLILAPFTFGASIIVTAVGISVATAGSITSASAKITDTIHSSMDRKKVEKMIQGYQEEITDIRKCLEFVQEGMDTLQEWDFDKYSQSATQKALNHNIKHVVKEGGRAGRALMINTDKLIGIVQVLSTAGGAARAAKAISMTTGVMSALFLALDVFFLAKDSHKLRKGAKTKFARKIRLVCKELQEGLLELNKVKTHLQKTMEGIEVEEYEEMEEVEVKDNLESDPKKLAELEKDIDFLEKKLDDRDQEEQRKSKEAEKGVFKIKKERSGKEKGKLDRRKESQK
uniref:Apolipoprotein L domain containing 1 n=3 Tax=Nothobranchius TaxID=28779 RepID=A0A1A8LRG8_9TELE